MRVISYCQQGVDKDHQTNEARLAYLANIVEHIQDQGLSNLNAIILPGGYLHLDTLDISKDKIDNEKIISDISKIIEPLKSTSDKLQLITGIDTAPSHKHGRAIGGQQLSIALNYNGVSGVARKICPVQEDFDGVKYPQMLVHEADFYDMRRYVELDKDKYALLCVCYDMFGFIDAARETTERMRNLVILEDVNGKLHEGRDAYAYFKETIQPKFQQVFQERRNQIALATANIHRFERSPKESFWHRHGIASASAAFNSHLSVGAAHFEKLPTDTDKATLSSYNVAADHLELAGHRKLNSHKADYSFYVKNETGTGTVGLARLYSDNQPTL